MTTAACAYGEAMAPRQQVTLTSDYGAGWPLWSARGSLLAPDALPLSAELTADLHSWQDLFDRQFHRDDGWRSPEAETRYARAAPELLHRLRGELGPAVQVTLDTWPVSDPDLVTWLSHRR
jgi:hypothetical protein